MIRIEIRVLAEKRGVNSSYQLAKLLKVSDSSASRLWKGSLDKIGISTLDKLCAVLKCTPNDLLRYEPSGKRR